MKKGFWYFVAGLILLIAGAAWWFLATAGERDKPVISAGEDSAAIGLQRVLAIEFSDQGTGLSLVEAANSGIVRFAGPLGIYGSTVIIDHGQGLASLYAHLSSVNVEPGRSVNKGDVIGTSGETGLAAGDHLHFSVLIGGRFVDPREWWDPHWIQDNVTKKMEAGF